MSNATRLIVVMAIAAGVSGCDQVTKYHAVAELTDALDGAVSLGDRLSRFASLDLSQAVRRNRTVVEGWWDHVVVGNPGGAFSALAWAPPSLVRPLLLFGSLFAMAVILGFAWRRRDPWSLWGVALVWGGAVGNFVDRLRMGYVIDFVHWHWGQHFSWPIFNVADVAVTVGLALLLVGNAAHVKATAAA